ncbi:MAG: hypothetical protein OEM59_00685 [Rhodospirillales bacterium]|nr:hypothetical protein [Rhodospirillales bacterium]
MKTLAAFLVAASIAAAAGPASAQTSTVKEYGEVPGVQGKAQTTINVEPGEYATVIVVARVSGGKITGEGVIPRAGVGVDIYVDDEICNADRDIRRQVDTKNFEGKFATSATCMTVLKPGKHTILAEKTNINVEDSKMSFRYSVLGGKPERIQAPGQ